MGWTVLTQTVWDFLEVSYRKGLLDQYFEFKGSKIDPRAPDGIEAMLYLEDKLSERDFRHLDQHGEKIMSILKAFSKEDVIEALKMILTMRTPPEGSNKEGI